MTNNRITFSGDRAVLGWREPSINFRRIFDLNGRSCVIHEAGYDNFVQRPLRYL